MNALTIALEVLATDVATVKQRLRAARPDVFNAIEGLHFLSMFVIDEQNGEEARVCLEASFDGGYDGFYERLFDVAASRALLASAFEFCGRCPPAHADVTVWRAFLENGEVENQIFYTGMPGHDVRRIEEESDFAAAVESTVSRLGAPESRRAANVRQIWDALTPARRDFAMRVPPRPFFVQFGAQPLGALYGRAKRWLYLLGLAGIALVAAEANHVPLWPWLRPPLRTVEVTGGWAFALACVGALLAAAWLALLIGEFPAALTLRMRASVFLGRVAGFILATLRALPVFAVILGLIAVLHWFAWCLILAELAVFAMVALALALVWAQRLIRIGLQEPSDRVRDLVWDARELARVCERENAGLQTHFVSVAPIRPGKLRLVTLKAVLWWVGNLATILHNPRGLFSTQSIHFARWCILPGESRMMFISNYDGSFGGYLGIFATLGASGVSAIWTNIDGFPRGFGLFGDGVRDEQRFKCYARFTQVETLLWYRRYPDLSVGAIGRNAAIREDLARFARVRTQDGERISEDELDTFLRRFSAPRP